MKQISVLGLTLSALLWLNFVSASNVLIPCGLVVEEGYYVKVSVGGFAPQDISTLFPNDSGYVGFIAEIETKRRMVKQFTGNAEYKVVGPRIEFERPDRERNSAITNLYMGEFREVFGMVPDVECYLP